MGRGSIIASSPQTYAEDGKEYRDRCRRFVSGGRVALHDIPKRRNARDKNKEIKESFFHEVSFKNEGAGKSDPFAKTTEESYTLSICQNQGPSVTPCAVIFKVTDAVAKSSRGSDASNLVQIIFAVFAIPESGLVKTTSFTV